MEKYRQGQQLASRLPYLAPERERESITRWIGLSQTRKGALVPADAVTQDTVGHEIERGPADAGHPFGGWSVVTLAARLAAQCGLRLSRAAVRRTLLALEFRWRRPRHELARDPEAAAIIRTTAIDRRNLESTASSGRGPVAFRQGSTADT